MMKNSSKKIYGAALAFALALASIASAPLHARGLSDVDAAGNPKGALVFPEPETSTFPTKRGKTARGIYRTADQLLMLKQGMGKSAVEDLLGEPHFAEGFPVFTNVREWDYIINDYCQLKILFNRDNNVTSWHWRDEAQCTPRKPEPQIVQPQLPAQKLLTLNGDALFDFDSSVLSNEGAAQLNREVLERLRQYQQQGFTYNSIEIVGHTDRLGTPEYNLALSQERATTVARYLGENGIPVERMKAYGAGLNEPVVHCVGNAPTAELKACLRPNRRVTVEFK